MLGADQVREFGGAVLGADASGASSTPDTASITAFAFVP